MIGIDEWLERVSKAIGLTKNQLAKMPGLFQLYHEGKPLELVAALIL